MRTKKQGTELDLYVMSQCVKHLEAVPVSSRRAIVSWLASRVLAEEAPQPAQPELFK